MTRRPPMTMLDTLPGPDFLHAVADAETAHGNTINAAHYRDRAHQWHRDREALATLTRHNAELMDNMADLQRRISGKPGEPPARTGAITPTDSQR